MIFFVFYEVGVGIGVGNGAKWNENFKFNFNNQNKYIKNLEQVMVGAEKKNGFKK